jgi:PAS domain S-box-containing protein/diguanylate cyclase (GGDEF)-like protein
MLTARDCLCPRYRSVGALERYRDVAERNGNEVLVYAVFDEDGARGRFLGLVEVREAALFPARVFADLLVRRQPPVLAPDTPVDEVWARLEQERCDYLPIVEDDGALRGVVSRLSLVAALMQHEHELNEERERLIGNLRCELENRKIAAAVFDATAEGIMVTDAQGRILLVNAAFSRTTGYADEEAIGQTPALLKSGRHDAAFYAAMWHEIDETGSWEGEIWNRRKSGEIYPEWLHIDLVRDEQGAPRYYVGVFADIGTHKELRAQLMHLAYHDALTGLPNRRLLLDRLGQAIARAQRNDTEVGVLFLDLDRFEDINESLGPGIGEALVVVAENQFSLAIGKQGLNVRLANRMVDWNIDVKTQKQFEEMDIKKDTKKAVEAMFDNFAEAENEEEITNIAELPGLPEKIIAALKQNGIELIEDLVTMDEHKLVALEGITAEDAQLILKVIEENVEIVEEEEEDKLRDASSSVEGNSEQQKRAQTENTAVEQATRDEKLTVTDDTAEESEEYDADKEPDEQQKYSTLDEASAVAAKKGPDPDEAGADEAVDNEETYECPECGGPITINLTHCPNCGVGLSFEEEDDESDE